MTRHHQIGRLLQNVTKEKMIENLKLDVIDIKANIITLIYTYRNSILNFSLNISVLKIFTKALKCFEMENYNLNQNLAIFGETFN